MRVVERKKGGEDTIHEERPILSRSYFGVRKVFQEESDDEEIYIKKNLGKRYDRLHRKERDKGLDMKFDLKKLNRACLNANRRYQEINTALEMVDRRRHVLDLEEGRFEVSDCLDTLWLKR